jgi:serine phosphatase RsbU (regulator of sigma subunit)/tetratricopeptide (TPR) repeat protein
MNSINIKRIIFLTFLILLFFLPVYLSAAVIDSLKLRLNDAKGKERIRVLINLMEKLEKREPEEALIYGNEALRLLDINPDKELTAEVLCHKGWAYLSMNEIDSAKYYSGRARVISRQSEFKKGLIMESLLSARIFRTEGLYDNAIKSLKNAEEINEDTGDIFLRIKILNELGSVYRRTSRYDESMECHEKALELFKEFKNDEELTTTYTFLGIINDIKGIYDKALGYHQLALNLNKKNKDARGTAGSIHNIGILYQKIEKYDQALEYYNQALQYWEQLNNPDARASTLNSIGAINELTQNYNEALKYYQMALEIWEKSGSKYSLSIGLNNLGSVHEYLGNYSQAIDYLQQAIRIRESLGDKDGMAGSSIVLSTVFNKMGRSESAIKTARHGLDLAKETGNIRTLREGHAVLAEIYESNGFFKEALAEFKNYKMAHDSLFNIESQEAIAEMQEKYKSEEQKQQIELLQKESEIQTLYRTLLIAGIILLLIIFALLYNRYRLKQKAANLRTEAAENKATVLQVQFEQKKKELEDARDLQLSMLPAKIPVHPKIEISALMLTATEVGGDYYDFHSDEDGALTIALGDATGHGAQAGIMVTAAKSLFNLLSDEKDISRILSKATGALRKMNFSNIFMALGLLRITDSRLELAGAGIPPAYIYRSSSGEVEEVPLKGLPLGSIFEFNYPKLTVKLNPGDVVAVTSDGFPELFNDKDEMLGFGKVPQLLKEAGKKSPEEIIKHFTNTASQWLNGTKQQDDMTFVVFKVK